MDILNELSKDRKKIIQLVCVIMFLAILGYDFFFCDSYFLPYFISSFLSLLDNKPNARGGLHLPIERDSISDLGYPP